MAVAGDQDHIVPAWHHAARLARQIPPWSISSSRTPDMPSITRNRSALPNWSRLFFRRLAATDPRDSLTRRPLAFIVTVPVGGAALKTTGLEREAVAVAVGGTPNALEIPAWIAGYAVGPRQRSRARRPGRWREP
jgi:hypothetical protein